MRISKLHCCCLLGAILIAGVCAAQAPSAINYQGAIGVDGNPFNGAGNFKFALVNAAGDVSYWSNDGTSAAGGEPTASVPLTCTNGRFSVGLGDTSQSGITQPIPASLFAVSETYLRVWFDDGVNGVQQLAPDSPLQTTPYSFQSVTAANADFATTAAQAVSAADAAALGGMPAANFALTSHTHAGQDSYDRAHIDALEARISPSSRPIRRSCWRCFRA